MTARLTLTAIAVAAAALLATTDAKAVPISTFYDTGVDASHATLANNAAETHYAIISTPDGSAPGARVATSANGFPIPPWIGNDSLSAWIGPKTDSALDGPSGQYDYRTTFSLTGFNANTAVLNGQWAADDVGVDILINGVSTKQTVNGFSAFSSFAVTSGFISGLNTIDFLVQNNGGPTGLRVEGVLTAAVPEPASVFILGVGLAGVGLFRRFKRT